MKSYVIRFSFIIPFEIGSLIYEYKSCIPFHKEEERNEYLRISEPNNN